MKASKNEPECFQTDQKDSQQRSWKGLSWERVLWPVFIEFGDKIASRKVFFVFGNDFALSTALSFNLFGFRKNCRSDKQRKINH